MNTIETLFGNVVMVKPADDSAHITFDMIIGAYKKQGYRPASFYEWAAAVKNGTVGTARYRNEYLHLNCVAICDQLVHDSDGQACAVVLYDASFADKTPAQLIPISSDISTLEYYDNAEIPFVKE